MNMDRARLLASRALLSLSDRIGGQERDDVKVFMESVERHVADFEHRACSRMDALEALAQSLRGEVNSVRKDLGAVRDAVDWATLNAGRDVGKLEAKVAGMESRLKLIEGCRLVFMHDEGPKHCERPASLPLQPQWIERPSRTWPGTDPLVPPVKITCKKEGE